MNRRIKRAKHRGSPKTLFKITPNRPNLQIERPRERKKREKPTQRGSYIDEK